VFGNFQRKFSRFFFHDRDCSSFWLFYCVFQRKRRRDVCKNALAQFMCQRLSKFLRKSIAVGNLKLVFYFTRVEVFLTKKCKNIFYLTVALVNSFFACTFSSEEEAPGITEHF